MGSSGVACVANGRNSELHGPLDLGPVKLQGAQVHFAK